MNMTCISPNCGSTIRVLFKLEKFDVHHCEKCGLLYRQPLPTEQELHEMYEDSNYLNSVYFSGQNQNASVKERPEIAIYQEGLAWLDNNLKHEKVRLLDVGCGTGFFLSMAKKRGWEVEGVEISNEHAKLAQEQFNVSVQNSNFIDVDFKPASYDAITMWDLLEHLEDPWASLKKARSLLKPGGVLVVFTINSASLFNRVAGLSYRMTGGMVRKAVELLYDKRHNFYFTQKSLDKVLVNEGFEIQNRIHHRAHLDRWLSEPAPRLMLIAADTIDHLSVLVGLQYRQLVFCRS